MSPDDKRHGTNAGYIAGCRNQCCRDAAAKKEALRRLAIMRGQSPTLPAVGAVRRVHALQALGWPPAVLSVHAGYSPGWLHAVMRTQTDRIYRRNHEMICRLYDEFSMRLGPSDITRLRARKAGWPPPLAWDDDTIDDPAATPVGAATRTPVAKRADPNATRVDRMLSGEWELARETTRAEKVEAMRRWFAAGRSEHSLCKLTGWKTGRYAKDARAALEREEAA